MAIVTILIFLMGLISFFNNKKLLTLISLFLLIYNYLGLSQPYFNIGSLTIQNSDLALLLIFILLPFRIKLNFKELKNINKSIIIFIVFLSFSLSYDLIFRETTPFQAFRSLRNLGFLFFYFIMFLFDYKDYKRFFNIIITITVIHSLIYISQYIFNFSFFSDKLLPNDEGIIRYSNSPHFFTITIILLIFKKLKNYFDYLKITIVTIAVLFTLSRGAISILLIIFLLALIFKYKKKVYKFVIPLSLFYMIFSFIISNTSLNSRFSKANNEITSFTNIDFDNLNSLYHQGSLIFRLGLTYERIVYVLEDPVRIILGVGFIPDMDIKRKIFVIGTHSEILPTGFEQYNSADIMLPNLITRFGIFGSLLFLMLIYYIFRFSLVNKDCEFGKILFTYTISLVFLSLNNQSFYQTQLFIMFFMMISMILSKKYSLSTTN